MSTATETPFDLGPCECCSGEPTDGCCHWCPVQSLCVTFQAASPNVWNSFGPVAPISKTVPIVPAEISLCATGPDYHIARYVAQFGPDSDPNYGLVLDMGAGPDGFGVCIFQSRINVFCTGPGSTYQAAQYGYTNVPLGLISRCVPFTFTSICSNYTDGVNIGNPASQPDLTVTVTAGPCGSTPQSAPMAMASNVSVPCRFMGEAITSSEANRIGLSTVREWKPCAKGHGQKGHVCGCQPWPNGGCDYCPDYQPADPDGGGSDVS